jgi:hypothetical protein
MLKIDTENQNKINMLAWKCLEMLGFNWKCLEITGSKRKKGRKPGQKLPLVDTFDPPLVESFSVRYPDTSTLPDNLSIFQVFRADHP